MVEKISGIANRQRLHERDQGLVLVRTGVNRLPEPEALFALVEGSSPEWRCLRETLYTYISLFMHPGYATPPVSPSWGQHPGGCTGPRGLFLGVYSPLSLLPGHMPCLPAPVGLVVGLELWPRHSSPFDPVLSLAASAALPPCQRRVDWTCRRCLSATVTRRPDPPPPPSTFHPRLRPPEGA